MKPAIVTPESLTRTATRVSTPKDFSAVVPHRPDRGTPRVGGQESGSPTRGMSPSARWVTTALKSLGVLTLVAVLVNDSGVTMAGFILAAAAPALLALTLAGSESAR